MNRSFLILSCIGLALASCGNPDSSTKNEAATTADTTATVSAQTSSEMLPGEKLIAATDCIGCHNKTQKVIGPAYVDIAAKYPASDENIDHLADAIIKGSKGTWGELPMTPHPGLNKDDAKLMVSWILSLKK